MAELIIPGLPDDIALLCLARVPPRAHAKLATVCSAWKQAVSSTVFKDLHQSVDLPSASEFLILMDTSWDAERFLTRVNSTIIDIASGCARSICFTNPDISSLKESIFLVGRGTVSYRSQIFIFGGYTMGHVSDRLHVFDMVSVSWSVGPSMLVPRVEFGYGIIGNRIYVAGGYVASGFFSEDDTQDHAEVFTPQAEMYDIVSREWVPIADMPLPLKCDFSWTHRGKFFIRGCYFDDSGDRLSKVICYNPPTDSWDEEPYMSHLLGNLKPLSRAKIVAVGKEEKLYMAVMKMSMYGPSSSFEVKKLNKAAQTWDSIMKTSDAAEHFSSSCDYNIASTPVVYALKDKVLTILHGLTPDIRFDTESIEIVHIEEVVEVYVSCPFSCTAAIVLV